MLWRATLVLALTCAGFAAIAQTEAELQAAQDATVAAFQAGDATATLKAAEHAATLALTMPDPPPTAYAFALNNLAFVLSTNGADAVRDPDRASALWEKALTRLQSRNQLATNAGFTVLTQLAAHEARQGQRDQALARLDTALALSRGTVLHGDVAAVAFDIYLTNDAYPQAMVALTELVASKPALLNTSFGDVYTRLNRLSDAAEQDGRTEDILTLIEGKIILLRTYMPKADAEPTINDLRFQRYFALRAAGQHDRARSDLLTWLKSGTLSVENRQFVQDMVDQVMLLADGANIDTLDRLNDARTAVGFAAGLNDPTDYRLGLAMRTIASAESHLGQNDRVGRSLMRAIDILGRSEQGRRYRHLALAELAWNTFLQGDPDQALALYQRADQARAALVGPDPGSTMEQANNAANRARIYLDVGQPDLAKTWATRARDLIGADPESDPWAQATLRTRLTQTTLLANRDLGDTNAPVQPLLQAIESMRVAAPRNSPEFSMALANAADTAFITGHRQTARTLLRQAIAINDAALPDIAPQSVETLAKMALLDISAGNRAAASGELRRATEARKSPLYRSHLAAASAEFELFAWTLVADPLSRSSADLAEAFEALQWTQITRSAEALSYLESRLSIDDPGRGTLLRQRQDLSDALVDLLARLSMARSRGDSPQVVQDLTRQLDQTETALAQADSTLGALGLDTSGVGQVMPVSLADTQALLGPDEALITFLLPGLIPEAVKGLTGSSNHVIAVTADTVTVAQIAEAARGNLRRRIKTFRCDVAISDPDCAGGGARGLRGAMLEGDEDEDLQSGYFDYGAAHQLYADLFGGVSDILKTHPHLIIVPPPDLLRLPFQALVTTPPSGARAAEADWMIRQNALSVLPSVSALRALRRGPTEPRSLTRMLGFGDPLIGPGSGPGAAVGTAMDCGAVALAALRSAPPATGFLANTPTSGTVALADVSFLASLPRLPDSACELQAIASWFAPGNSTLLVGAEATETRVKSLNASGALSHYDVLVFATHGLTAGESGAVSPGLVLTPPATGTAQDDGLLSAAEIAGLNLNAGLVVLSACNTAAGDAGDEDGLSGLARGFFRAGAKSLLVTHWSVYSEAAVDMSTGLFSALETRKNLGFSAALRAATLDILADPNRPAFHHHPSYWAAFSIIGDT